MLDKKKNRPDLESEMDELQRVVQDLSRDENIEITVDQLVDAFNKSNETTLTDDIWEKLENTESNEIGKDNWKAVFGIAKKYNKTDPAKLKKSIEKGEYKRPLIINFGDRYHLVAGNTRLSTAAAMGVNPKVFIAKIDMMNESEDIKGGVSDKKTLKDLASKHTYNDSSDSVDKAELNNMMKHLKDQLRKGIKVEMEHTDDDDKAREIAMDHLWEDPNYYTKLSKVEVEESMDSGSSGSFEPALSAPILKKDLYKQHNTKKYNVSEVVDSSSSGQYDVPFGDGGKNPLKINGEKSIKQSRAVKDKKFPKWGGPNSVFIKIKEKCKKFPYCNQDINAIEMLEMEELTQAIQETSKNYGIPYKEVEKIVLNEIRQIFI
jgi:Ca2+-binding EF-hand superfamily protein